MQVAWAPPKSINEDKKLKEFWEVTHGAAYIPWGQMPSDLSPITASGEAVLDESSMPGALTARLTQKQAAEKPAAPEHQQLRHGERSCSVASLCALT